MDIMLDIEKMSELPKKNYIHVRGTRDQRELPKVNFDYSHNKQVMTKCSIPFLSEIWQC